MVKLLSERKIGFFIIDYIKKEYDKIKIPEELVKLGIDKKYILVEDNTPKPDITILFSESVKEPDETRLNIIDYLDGNGYSYYYDKTISGTRLFSVPDFILSLDKAKQLLVDKDNRAAIKFIDGGYTCLNLLDRV